MNRPLRIVGLLVLLAGCAEGSLSGTTSGLTAASEGADFGHVYIGETGTVTVELTGTGTGATHLTGAQISPTDITVTPDLNGLTLWPGEARLVSLRWTPQAPGVMGGGGLLVHGEGVDPLVVVINGEALPTPDCNDGNDCTQDAFEPRFGHCVHSAIEDTECDDGNLCTQDDRCDGGRCVGTALACGDDNECTTDLCDPTVGCINPENTEACADGNPCRVGICVPGADCESTSLADGTPCGVPSCTEAFLCAGGNCESYDISSTSDGMVCSDGNACTSDDVCVAGVCAGDQAVQVPPAVTANFDTFGGGNSAVATDGYRYVFTEREAVIIAIKGNTGELEITATVPAYPTSVPVSLGAGRFAYAGTYSLFIIDALNADAPLQYYAGPSPFATVRDLYAVDGGVVMFGDGAASPHIQFMLLEPDLVSFTLGPIISGWFSDLDARGNTLAAVNFDAAYWYRFTAQGVIAESHAFSTWDVSSQGASADAISYWDRISVWNRKVGLLGNGNATIVNIPPMVACEAAPNPIPTCANYAPTPGVFQTIPAAGEYLECDPDLSAVPCMSGTQCRTVNVDTCPGAATGCSASLELCLPPLPAAAYEVAMWRDASDIVITDQLLVTSGPEGTDVHDFFNDPYTPIRADRIPADRIERGPDHLLLRGTIAMPLRADGGPMFAGMPIVAPEFEQITGPMHGDLWGIALNGDSVHASGIVSTGSYNRTDRDITHWAVEDFIPASSNNIRVVKGDQRSAGVPAHTVVSSPGQCGPEFSIYNADAAAYVGSTQGTWCGVETGQYAVNNEFAWVYGPVQLDGAVQAPEGVLQKFSFVDTQPLAQFSIHGIDQSSMSTVRLTDDGEQVAVVVVSLVGAMQAPVSVTLLDTAPGATPESFPLFSLPVNGLTSRKEVAVDGRSMLATSWASLTLVDLDDPTAPVLGDIPGSVSSRPDILWMDEGRAWVAWRGDHDIAEAPQFSIGPDEADSPPPPIPDSANGAAYISEFRYGPGLLEHVGDVPLPAPARDLAMVGDEVYVVTETGLYVVQSTCQ